MASETKAKKGNIFKRVLGYFKDMRGEIKKVVWPSRKQIVNYTIVVLVTMAIVALFITIVDFGLKELIGLLFDLLGKKAS